MEVPDRNSATISINPVQSVIYAGDDAEVTITSDSGADLTVTVDGKKYELTGNLLTIKNISEGSHLIQVTSPQTAEYKQASNSTLINVVKKDSELTIMPLQTDIYAGDDVEVLITSDSDADLVVSVDGKIYELNEGVLTITNISAGLHKIDVVSPETGEYKQITNSTMIDAVKKDTELSVNVPQGIVYAGSDVDVVIISNSDAGLVVSVDGVNYDAVDGVLTIRNISAGSHAVQVVSPETYQYSAATGDVIIINAVKKDTELSVDVPQGIVFAGSDVDVVITSNSDAGLVVSVDGVNYDAVDGVLTIRNISAGSHAVQVVSPETYQYSAATSDVIFIDVVKRDVEISIEVQLDEIYAGDDVEVEIISDSDDITVTVDGVLYDVEDGFITIRNISAGSHTIEAVKYEDDRYNGFDAIEVIAVEKQTSKVSITVPQNVKAGQDATIEVSSYDGADITVYIDGVKQQVKDGKVTVKATAGEHTVTASVDESYTHLASNDTKTFEVTKLDAEIDVSVTNVSEGQPITVTVNTGLDEGIVIVKVGDKEAAIDLAKFKSASITLDAPGTYEVSATYLGSDIYNAAEAENSTVVVKAKEDSKVNIEIPQIKAGEDANVTVDIPGATGNVSVIIDGKENIVALDENGRASVPVEATAGDHSVVVVYDGDETHAPAHSASRFSVEAEPEKVATEFADITVNDKIVTLVLKDADGNVISGANVSYSVNGVSKSVVTGSDGSFSVVGDYGVVISIDYAGDDKYLAVNTTLKFENMAPVKTDTLIKAEDFSQYSCDFYEGERGENFTFQLKDVNGKPVANRDIYIGYNGVTVYRTTDANGYASVQINLKNAGLYTFVIVFLGDNDYTASMAVHKVTIEKKTTSISASAKTFKATVKTKKYTVTLKTIKGASIDGKTYLAAGKKLTLDVNGKIFNAKTNAKGQATFKITNLKKKGTFTAKVSFAGDVSYQSASKSVKLTIK